MRSKIMLTAPMPWGGIVFIMNTTPDEGAPIRYESGEDLVQEAAIRFRIVGRTSPPSSGYELTLRNTFCRPLPVRRLAKTAKLERFPGLSPENQYQNMVLTVLSAPRSLGSGRVLGLQTAYPHDKTKSTDLSSQIHRPPPKGLAIKANLRFEIG